MLRRTLLLAVPLLLLCVPVADAYVIGGKRWPGRAITWHADPRVRTAARDAARLWNASGLHIRFRETSRARARVLVRDVGPGCAGIAQLGWSASSAADVWLHRCPHRWPATQVAAHEFGHILGLGHQTRRCALMNKTIQNEAPDRCGQPPKGSYRCRVLEPDDLAGARRLYGGRPKVRKPATCALYGPVGAVGFDVGPAAGGLLPVAYRLPPAPKRVVDTFDPDVDVRFQVTAVAGSCPADASGLLSGDTFLLDDGEGRARVRVPAYGPVCVAGRAVDSLGRRGPVVARTVQVAPPAPDAGFSWDPSYGEAGDTFRFSGGYGEDPVVAWAWDFGDPGSGAANSSSAPEPQHTFAAAGDYTVTLTVTTQHGATATSSQVVTVLAPYGSS